MKKLMVLFAVTITAGCAVVSQPAVTVAPVTTVRTTQRNVWVEGRYFDQVQNNGTVVRVWNPGHYET